MLHIERVVIHNFKSFKHANIGFSRGFNCIAGPNGSGKSNVCDSLLFALGEQSLRRMRVSSSSQLINDRKMKGDLHTYVKVSFSGDRNLEIVREIKGDRIIYRLGGKAVSRQDMVSALRESHCEINETNTITQGETAKLLAMNPKERRELIDIASGIREFDIKKGDALKELEKVEGKIGNAQVLLNERVGFLEELAKEKEQAERFIALSDRLKSVTYTILKMREEQLSQDYKNRFEACKEGEMRKKEAERKISEIEKRVTELLSKKEELARKLNESSMDASSNNRQMEQLGKGIAIAEARLESIESSMKDLSERRRKLSSEADTMKLKSDENSKLIEIAKGELANYREDEKGIEAERLSAEYKSSQKRMESLSERRDSIERDYVHMLSDSEALDRRIDAMQKEAKGIEERVARSGKSRTAIDSELEKEGKSEGAVLEQIKALEGESRKARSEREALDEKSILLREQLAAASGGSDRIDALLGKGIKSGYFGRAQDLLSYEEKYALAVAAAGSSRLNYFVVDRIETAEKAIRFLKEGKGGRATFIPLNDIRVREGPARKDLKPVLSCVTFDRKFAKAFSYVFSNTYLIDAIGSAKKSGIGSSRYVTLEGELVESSGVVSGGNTKARLSAANVRAELEKIAGKAAEINGGMADIENKVASARKELSSIESRKVKLEVELKYSSEEIAKLTTRKEELRSELKESVVSSEKLKALMEKLSEERQEASSMLEEERRRSSDIYSKLTGNITRSSGNATESRDSAEANRLKIAELSKENSMMSDRLEAISKDIKEIGGGEEKLKRERTDILKTLEKSRKGMEELKEKTKGYDRETQGMYARVREFDSSIAEASTEKGRLQSGIERMNSDMLENETAKAQIEVRLGDIKAELSSYQSSRIEGMGIKELEAEQISSKRELESMGAVNLKAPELYERRRKDVDEAQQQMSVLESEKSSILGMIDQIESKKLNIFNSTLSAVNKNFKSLYGHIFPGEADLVVDNQKDPFGSGLTISMVLDRRQRHMERLSGGERLLVMLMLLFAIQMMRPMSFYLFDEIDASLDKENSKKLSLLIKELAGKSQFIVVTHNDSMIANSDTGIGIAMHGRESRAIGIVLNSQG